MSHYWEKELFHGWDSDWECEPIPDYVLQRAWKDEQARVQEEKDGNREECEKDRYRKS